MTSTIPPSSNRLSSSRNRPYPHLPPQFYQRNQSPQPQSQSQSPQLPRVNRRPTLQSLHTHSTPPPPLPPSSRAPQTTNQPIPIPSAIPPIVAQQDSTPLPTLPIVVLCFAMISEFLSASVSGPFIFFMIEDFGVGGGEAAVGFWAGIVSSVFFLSQFLTSLLWSNVSNKHGRRIVLFSSLLGNAITLILFGSSTSLPMAICARLGQGIFNGAIGVARGAVRDLTDSTNEGRAIAWIGLCWGMGGITGPIIGGLLEHPAENYPSLFGRFQLLKDHPYILPCAVASSVTFMGAILSLFLGWDGGYRTGKIRLVDTTKLDLPGSSVRVDGRDTEDQSVLSSPQPNQAINLLRSSLSSQSIPNAPQDAHALANPNSPRDPAQSIAIKNAIPISRTSTRQSHAFTPGSAYGYDRSTNILSRRPFAWRDLGPVGSTRTNSYTLNRRGSRVISLARSFGDGTHYAPDYDELNPEETAPALNFAQRLLLANEDAVFGLHDVWLAAATTQDRDDEYSQIDEDGLTVWEDSVYEDELGGSRAEFDDERSDSQYGSFDGRGRDYILRQQQQQQQQRRMSDYHFQSIASRVPSAARGARDSLVTPDSYNPPPPASSIPPWLDQKMRTTSMASSVRPAIFSNTGLATPRSMLNPSSFIGAGGPSQSYSSRMFHNNLNPNSNHHHDVVNQINSTLDSTVNESGASLNNNLDVIRENRSNKASSSLPPSEQNTNEDSVHHPKPALVQNDYPLLENRDQNNNLLEVSEKSTSLFHQLPLAIIAQYAIVALHGTTCDQVFMSFLVTPIKSGGLGLSAGHYAELIAAMCIAQIMFQFRFYPTVGPPRGKLSHLSMFRLGLSLYIPVYMLLPELRGLLRENHNGLVMFGMILLSSFRWLANVCAYTSVMVMINAQTPSHLIPLANGLAQSAVSASRFVGPVFGGLIWSFSITPSPDFRSYPFNNSFGFLVISLICFTGLCFSFRLK